MSMGCQAAGKARRPVMQNKPVIDKTSPEPHQMGMLPGSRRPDERESGWLAGLIAVDWIAGLLVYGLPDCRSAGLLVCRLASLIPVVDAVDAFGEIDGWGVAQTFGDFTDICF
jgi:hypothetical protein